MWHGLQKFIQVSMTPNRDQIKDIRKNEQERLIKYINKNKEKAREPPERIK